MKKLIKNGVCEIREQCIYTLFTKDRSIVAAEKKKKKKRKENADAALKRAIQTYTISTSKNILLYLFMISQREKLLCYHELPS